MRKRAFLFCAVLLVSAGCDHATKEIARRALETAPPLSLVGDVVRLELVANSGAFLSLGAALPEVVRDIFFLGLVPLLLAALCVMLFRTGTPSLLQAGGLGLVAGGGIANWLDRLVNDGAVTDFVSLGLGPLRTGIFNVADVAILLGLALVLLTSNLQASDRT